MRREEPLCVNVCVRVLPVCTCVYVYCVCEERREMSTFHLLCNVLLDDTVYHTVQLYYILTCSNKPIYMQAMWRGLTVFHTVQLVQMRRATKMMQRSVHVCVGVRESVVCVRFFVRMCAFGCVC